LVTGQRGQGGKFHPLHRGFDAPQGMAMQQNFVCGEDQTKLLLLSLALEFSKGELVER